MHLFEVTSFERLEQQRSVRRRVWENAPTLPQEDVLRRPHLEDSAVSDEAAQRRGALGADAGEVAVRGRALVTALGL